MNLTVDTIGASRHLGLGVSTLEKLRVTGGGPRYVKLGRAVRYRLCDLEEYLADRVLENTSQAGSLSTVVETATSGAPRKSGS